MESKATLKTCFNGMSLDDTCKMPLKIGAKIILEVDRKRQVLRWWQCSIATTCPTVYCSQLAGSRRIWLIFQDLLRRIGFLNTWLSVGSFTLPGLWNRDPKQYSKFLSSNHYSNLYINIPITSCFLFFPDTHCIFSPLQIILQGNKIIQLFLLLNTTPGAPNKGTACYVISAP